jgi:hypothetical protein
MVAHKYTRQINALACNGAVLTPEPWRSEPVAAGERIVAFARPGKPPGYPVF